MNWVISCMIMFFSSVILYLFVRKSLLSKVPSQYVNLANFGIPLLLFASIGLYSRQNFLIPISQILIIVLMSVFFSYVGSRSSLKSICYAPNPGYSLIISKSYVVFTTLVAIILFKAELSLKKLAAIGLIVVFSTLIMFSKKTLNKTVNKMWLPLAIIAFFCWGMVSLTSKYLFNQGVNLYVFLTYVYLVVTSCIVLETIKKRVKITSISSNLWILLIIGLFSASFNFFGFQAIKTAPNIGYMNAVDSASISAVTVLAALIFKDEFTQRKFIGVLGVTTGLILLLF